MAKRISASASVVVTLRIKSGSSWGPECSLTGVSRADLDWAERSMSQIHQQAKEDVQRKLELMAEAVKGTDIMIVKWDYSETISTEGK